VSRFFPWRDDRIIPNPGVFSVWPKNGIHKGELVKIETRRTIMLSVEIKENEKVVGTLAAAEKLFKTGSRGFFGMGKIQIGEKRYQVQVQLVEIGSKPKVGEDALKDG
jgi:hypothetical protein